jgi:hypothetical protein
MTKRLQRLLLLAILISGFSLYFSCTQPEDILSPIKKTDVYLWGKAVVPGTPNLKPQNLPSNPPGMMYELWVANAQETLSLGKFGYDQEFVRFLDENGEPRADSNHFELSGDIFRFTHIFVSVETHPDDNPASPGPIMLIDEVSDPSNDLIDLRFPLSDSLWNATVRYNMETTSDGDRDALDGYGIWFSQYSLRKTPVQDTFGLISVEIDTIWKESIEGDDTSAIVAILDVETLMVERVLGFDTITYSAVRWRDSIEIDSTPEDSFLTTRVKLVFDTSETETLYYDEFWQDNFDLPDYSDYGWKYKGWVVSPEVPKSAVGEITKPAYPINDNPTDSLIPGIDGGLLSTGTFSDITKPDDENPYSLSIRVPQFPGEDFLTNLPGGLRVPPSGSWGGLLPEETGNSGTVFITLEPVNFVTDTTNFPLFAFVKALPKNRAAVQDYVGNISTFTMYNLTSANRPTRSFPRIVVDIRRF